MTNFKTNIANAKVNRVDFLYREGFILIIILAIEIRVCSACECGNSSLIQL